MKRLIFTVIGAFLSAAVPIAVTLSYFPLWRESGEAAISGISLLLLLIAAVPIFRIIKKILATPSAPVIWLLVFIAFLLFSRIANEVTVISFFGFISNAVGAIFFKLAAREEKNK